MAVPRPADHGGPDSVRLTVEGADVGIGRDGWLFLIGGTNDVRNQYRRSWRTRWHAWRWARLLRRRAQRCRRLGVAYAHLVVPEKLTVYDDRLDAPRVDVAAAPTAQLKERLGRAAAQAWVDLAAPFRARRDAEALYLRTDSHWSHAGCYLAYEALCRHLGAVPREELREGRFLREADYRGDLGAKLDPPRGERVRLHALRRDAVRVDACRLVLDYEAAGRIDELHRGSHVVYRNDNPAADPRRLVLFGDSYANLVWDAAPGMLTGLLAETFREVHFLWTASMDWAYVAQVRPDIVVTETAERFMRMLPRFDHPQGELEARMRALKAVR